MIGLIASLAGLVAGVFVAGGLKSMIAAFGIDVPASGTVFRPRTGVIAMAVGLLTTVVSAVFPSIRASRVTPIGRAPRHAASHVGSGRVRRARDRAAPWLSSACARLRRRARPARASLWVGIGALLMFLGVFVLGPAHRPSRPCGSSARLCRASPARAVCSLGRTRRATRSARLARAAPSWSASRSSPPSPSSRRRPRDWIRDVYSKQFSGDFVVSTNTVGFGGISTRAGQPSQRLARGGRRHRCPGGRGALTTPRNGGGRSHLRVRRPGHRGQVVRHRHHPGQHRGARPSTASLVDDNRARDSACTWASTVEFGFVNGTTRTLTVEGIYSEDDLATAFVVSHALHEQSGADQFDFSVFVGKAPGVSEADAAAAIAAARRQLSERQGPEPVSEYLAAQTGQIDQIAQPDVRTARLSPSSSPCSASPTASPCRSTNGPASSACSAPSA